MSLSFFRPLTHSSNPHRISFPFIPLCHSHFPVPLTRSPNPIRSLSPSFPCVNLVFPCPSLVLQIKPHRISFPFIPLCHSHFPAPTFSSSHAIGSPYPSFPYLLQIPFPSIVPIAASLTSLPLSPLNSLRRLLFSNVKAATFDNYPKPK